MKHVLDSRSGGEGDGGREVTRTSPLCHASSACLHVLPSARSSLGMLTTVSSVQEARGGAAPAPAVAVSMPTITGPARQDEL